MAPASGPRSQPQDAHNQDRIDTPTSPSTQVNHQSIHGERTIHTQDLFLDPMMGTPLTIFVAPDVEDRAEIVDLIQGNGGVVAAGYSSVPYILVNPRLPSGQSLYRQYAGKKGKIVLASQWVHECVSAGALQTFMSQWAGCRLTGNELQYEDSASELVHEPPLVQDDHDMGNDPPSDSEAGPSGEQPSSPIAPGHYPPESSTAGHAIATPGHSYPPHGSLYAQHQHAFSVIPGPTGVPPRYVAVVPNHGHGAPASAPPHPGPSHVTHLWPHAYHLHAHESANGVALQSPPNGQHVAYRQHENWGEPGAYGSAPPPGGPHYYPPTPGWAPMPGYYDHHYGHYPHGAYAVVPPHESIPEVELDDTQRHSNRGPARGRRRARNAPQPAAGSAAGMVLPRRGPPERSPTPPTKVVKSTYGGNHFTEEDKTYLRQYIDYCQRQGLVLSLREICERIAVKCPHHTFYSWRRYCNKNKIRLGGYAMEVDGEPEGPQASTSAIREPDPPPVDGHSTMPPSIPTINAGAPPHLMIASPPLPLHAAGGPPPPHEYIRHPQTFVVPLHGPPSQLTAHGSESLALSSEAISKPVLETQEPTETVPPPPEPIVNEDEGTALPPGPAGVAPPIHRQVSRSPSPPKALFRSTTGKGVAFTQADVQFLADFLSFRRSQGRLDMVQFWKDVAARAPHHSRASWMKYFRRHRHDLAPNAETRPLPPAPEKKLRYGRADDILLARYLATHPTGTSDQMFQEFARQYPHHPWKGWQEHARIHKAAIDHLIQKLERGEELDESVDQHGAMVVMAEVGPHVEAPITGVVDLST